MEKVKDKDWKFPANWKQKRNILRQNAIKTTKYSDLHG